MASTPSPACSCNREKTPAWESSPKSSAFSTTGSGKERILRPSLENSAIKSGWASARASNSRPARSSGSVGFREGFAGGAGSLPFQDLLIYAEGAGREPDSVLIKDGVFDPYVPQEAPYLRHRPRALRGIGVPKALDLVAKNVLEYRYGAGEQLGELFRLVLTEPIGGIFTQAQNPKVQFHSGGRDRRSSHVADPATFPRIFGVDRFPGRRPGLLRGFLPGLIRVKEKVNAVCVAAEGAKVGGGCRRAQGGDGVLYAGLVEHQHIGVALDDEHRAFLAYSLQDLGEAVEQVALVEDLRLGGVQVLGMIVTEGTGPEADDPAAPVGDREGDPASKTLPPRAERSPAASRISRSNPSFAAALTKPETPRGGA